MMKKGWPLVGLAAVGVAGGLLLVADPLEADDRPGNCFVTIEPLGPGQDVDQAVASEPQCFDTKEQLYDAERRLGLRH
jgi:hypothetical protein